MNDIMYYYSEEGKTLLKDKLAEVATSLISAYDSGELIEALEEGHSGWKKWVKSFGKSLNRKVSSLGHICNSPTPTEQPSRSCLLTGGHACVHVDSQYIVF